MKTVLIIGGGPLDLSQLQLELAKGPDLIIAADRGGYYLTELAVLPEVLIGDFDSLPSAILQQMQDSGVEVKTFPVNKEYTDLELAVDLAVERGATRINILGGLGGRLDHTLANIGLLLKLLEQGVEAHLLDAKHDIILVKDEVTLKSKPDWAVSLMPLSLKVTGVTTTGLAYGLDQAELYYQNTRGIHNEFIAETATVKLTRGILMVICFQVS